MKLITKTYRSTLIWLLPVMLIGSVFCFHTIEYIAHEETDEFLTYEKDRLIKFHKEHKTLPDFHKVAAIYEVDTLQPTLFKDTLILELGDNEMVPNRELQFSIPHNDKYFTIVLRHLLLGKDDILEGTLLIVVGILFIMAIMIIIILYTVNKRIWKPFHHTLSVLNAYQIKKEIPTLEDNQIDEFNQLNHSIINLLNKINTDFNNHKEFTENMSHEVQTYLTIIKQNTEQLMGQIAVENKQDLTLIKKTYAAVNDLNKVQKSLILLTKINNEEFHEVKQFDFQDKLKAALIRFEDLIEIRNIKTSIKTTVCKVEMDPGLAEIILNNLLKNAVKHNIENGSITVELAQESLTIKNTGKVIPGEPSQLMNRFITANQGNMGIGLAIVQQICLKYDFTIKYHVDNKGIHQIIIYF
ncbi:hypothetical protein DNU06_04025 [Putridiphycobacter roseus]|uniref:histidine kinase n=1 Tax=Putridiphycobacter roseus TaxID=2219161 RepID=A0A2W1NEE3_9FLAO|nr:HAMP domain-containing sensor histidine kinase [Putridiphycobacter roseus]PZE17795.1 hypothetical protein DNU06_04025 [Putridiphycobacter roseus]